MPKTYPSHTCKFSHNSSYTSSTTNLPVLPIIHPAPDMNTHTFKSSLITFFIHFQFTSSVHNFVNGWPQNYTSYFIHQNFYSINIYFHHYITFPNVQIFTVFILHFLYSSFVHNLSNKCPTNYNPFSIHQNFLSLNISSSANCSQNDIVLYL